MAAVAASICCIGPIAAALLGISGLAALVKYEFLRPLFAGITGVILAGAFYLAYRKQPETDCEEGSLCETQGRDRMQRANRVVLWIVTVAVVAILTFPTWSNWVL